MKTEDFIVYKRSRLAEVTQFPEISVADYEQRLKSFQSNLQMVQQAYLGAARNAPWSYSKDGIRQAKVGSFGVWDGLWTRGASRSIRSPRLLYGSRPSIICSAFGKGFRSGARSWCSIRSWYGRVLVERVEELATAHEWKRAYREINEFERTLVADGIRLDGNLPPYHSRRTDSPFQG